MTRVVTAETRRKISRKMRGKRNAAGKHKMTEAGRAAISAAQRQRWERYREEQLTSA